MPQKKILIVDSDAASRNFIARKLEDLKFDVLQAGSGKEGLIFTWRDRPDLVIIDPVLTDIKGEEVAAKLRADARTTSLPLVALSSDHNPTRLRLCQEAGFNEYITKSGQAVPMLTDIVNRLFGLSKAEMQQGGLMLVFFSAKGGTGTSSFCANIAVNILKHQPEARVVVADLVLPIGSIDRIVGYEGVQNILTVSQKSPLQTDKEFFQKELPAIELWNFNLLAGSPDPELSGQLNASRVWDVIMGLKQSYDYVLVDIGRSLSKITLPLLQHADLAVMMVSTDVSTISLTDIVLGYLETKGISQDTVYTILNRHASLEGLSKREAENLLGIKINAAIPYLGPNFGFANSQHRPFTLKFPTDTASIIFHESAREMIELARKRRS